MFLQDLCSRLAETIWSMRQQLKQLLGLKEKIADPQVKPNDQEMLDNITELLRKLVVETFVVEKQPPQVKANLLGKSNKILSNSSFSIRTKMIFDWSKSFLTGPKNNNTLKNFAFWVMLKKVLV